MSNRSQTIKETQKRRMIFWSLSQEAKKAKDRKNEKKKRKEKRKTSFSFPHV
jgi:hypothetical protein